MSESTPAVAVIGGGVYGWTAALRLAERGCAVTVFDPREPGSAEASSGGISRILRFEYGGDRLYPELTRRALPVWAELERRAGQELYRPLGVLYLVGEGDDGSWERASAEVDGDLGMAAEQLTPAELGRRWPAISPAGLDFAIHNPNGGLLHAARAVRAIAALARTAGVAWAAEAVAEPPDGFDQVLLTCGPWTPRLRPELAIVATRQVSIHLDAGPGDIPVFGEGAPFAFYGFPAYDGVGFKIGDHVTGPAGDPGDPAQRQATEDEIAHLRAHAARRFPATAGAAVRSADVCFYAMTVTEDPVVARLDERTVVCAGFSGHGFKFSPVVAEAAADLVMEREPAISMARFAAQ